MFKYLLVFAKEEPLRWIGHLDILRCFERAVRRAGLPIAFTQGYNPRERLTFASALGTGITASQEYAVIELTAHIDPVGIRGRLAAVLPRGLAVRDVAALGEEAASAVIRCRAADYAVVCDLPHGAGPADLSAAITALLAADSVTVIRNRDGRQKPVEIRRFIQQLELSAAGTPAEPVTVRMRLTITDAGAARPSDVIAALEARLPGVTGRRPHRVRLLTDADALAEVPQLHD